MNLFIAGRLIMASHTVGSSGSACGVLGGRQGVGSVG
jgi:hypothetical protein